MIDQDLHKVCPVCDGEYRFDIERCADCGVPLVHPQEIALRDARELPRSPELELRGSAAAGLGSAGSTGSWPDYAEVQLSCAMA